MEVLSIGTKVKIKDMNDAIGYINTIVVVAETRVNYEVVYYNKNTCVWNNVTLPEAAFSVCKSDKDHERTTIGF
jgi:hypothetical protein